MSERAVPDPKKRTEVRVIRYSVQEILRVLEMGKCPINRTEAIVDAVNAAMVSAGFLVHPTTVRTTDAPSESPE